MRSYAKKSGIAPFVNGRELGGRSVAVKLSNKILIISSEKRFHGKHGKIQKNEKEFTNILEQLAARRSFFPQIDSDDAAAFFIRSKGEPIIGKGFSCRVYDLGGNDLLIVKGRPEDRAKLLKDLCELNDLRIRALEKRLKIAEKERDKALEDSGRDHLTGLPNRRHGEVAVAALFAGIARTEREIQSGNEPARTNRGAAIILIDIDHFKSVNDRYGHPVGDKLLVKFAAILRENTRPSDVCFRFGGEEFCVVAPCNAREDAEQIAEKLRRKIEEKCRLTNLNVVKTASLGSTYLPSDIFATKDKSLSDIFKCGLKIADAALYMAKGNGRNCCCFMDHPNDPRHPCRTNGKESPPSPSGGS